MFQVPLNELFECYLVTVLVITFTIWIAGNWRRRRREVAAQRKVVECTICGQAFQDLTRNPLPRCPNCGRLNERSPYKSL